jgi:hypothetical protein
MSTISSPAVAGVAGAATQVRTAASAALRLASRSMIALALIGSLGAINSTAAHAADASVQSHRTERHLTPILNGRHVQPTQAELPRLEMSPRSAKIVDELYQQLINPRGC